MCLICYFFFFQAEDGIRDVAVTGVQTCALPILKAPPVATGSTRVTPASRTINASTMVAARAGSARRDRKSTRLNSSHGYISYAVFCLKKKKKTKKTDGAWSKSHWYPRCSCDNNG